jgi:flagellar basal-body rod modification protein FlgD
MSVSAVSNSTPYGAATSQTPASTSRNTLDQADFLQLLSLQFQQQDPLKPMDDTSFLAQMAQFTSLQQMNTLTGQITLLRSDQQKMAAAAYLGRTVTVSDGDHTVSGQVASVDTSGDTPQLVINGISYPLSSLLSVDQPATTPATDSPAA